VTPTEKVSLILAAVFIVLPLIVRYSRPRSR
jgi:hypothetical protein